MRHRGLRSRLLAIPTALLLLLVACGGASFTDKASGTLRTSLAALDAARDEFVAWDKAHQLELVDGSATKEEAEAKLRGYREKRQRVLRAFTIAYTAIAAAAAIIPLVERGIKREADLVPLLVETMEAVTSVRAAWTAMQGE